MDGGSEGVDCEMTSCHQEHNVSLYYARSYWAMKGKP